MASTTKFLEARVYDWSEDQEEEEAAPLAGEQSQASVSPESEVRARALIEAKRVNLWRTQGRLTQMPIYLN